MTDLPSGPGIREEFEALPLPLAAVDLERMRIRAVTPSLLSLLGLPASALIGQPVLDVIAAADRQRATLALEALRTGAVDFARGHGRFAAGGNDVYTNWLAAVEVGGERVALAQVAHGSSPASSPLERFLGREPVHFAVGTVDRSWVITTVSSGVEQLLGTAAEDVVGRVLLGSVERPHVERVLRAAHRATADLSVGVSVRMRGADGGWRDVRAVIGLLASSSARFFVLTADARREDLRRLKFEEHLRRIAAEVTASGILEVAPTVPAMTRLVDHRGFTPRQWDVLTRLLRGERVATIADELFVSESTVRNHLSAIFQRVGVRSQAELMALAAGDRDPSG